MLTLGSRNLIKMTKKKRETFPEICEHCGRELSEFIGLREVCCEGPCIDAREGKKYRGHYSLTEYRTAITEAYHHVSRQLLHGIHAQDKQDAADWLEKHGPLARALQIAANHGIK